MLTRLVIPPQAAVIADLINRRVLRVIIPNRPETVPYEAHETFYLLPSYSALAVAQIKTFVEGR